MVMCQKLSLVKSIEPLNGLPATMGVAYNHNNLSRCKLDILGTHFTNAGQAAAESSKLTGWVINKKCF